ncbi:hypothetical protein OH76DRAFT_1361364, partial [Lentinus brumalis]
MANPLAQAVLTSAQAALLNALPSDIRTVLKALKAEPDVVLYATCSACCATYAPSEDNPDDPYPHVCTYSEMNQPICGTPLVYATHKTQNGQKKVVYKSIKTYPYRSIKWYIAALLARVGVEDLLEKSFSEEELGELVETWRDIMESTRIRRFRGPDGRTRFSVQVNGELHLVFAMFVDWFNPHGNKQAGKSHSVGAIYLACLNLPPHLRFRPEYIYLAGVIP